MKGESSGNNNSRSAGARRRGTRSWKGLSSFHRNMRLALLALLVLETEKPRQHGLNRGRRRWSGLTRKSPARPTGCATTRKLHGRDDPHLHNVTITKWLRSVNWARSIRARAQIGNCTYSELAATENSRGEDCASVQNGNADPLNLSPQPAAFPLPARTCNSHSACFGSSRVNVSDAELMQ